MQPEHEYPDRNSETPSWPPPGDERPGDGVHWAMLAIAAVTLLLVLVNFGLNLDVRSIQGEVNQRQQFINQATQLGRVHEALVRALAQVAVKENDDRLRDLLTQNGITINVTPPTTAGATSGGGSTAPAGAASGAAAKATGSEPSAGTHPAPAEKR